MILQTIDIDMIPGKDTPVVYVNQGDWSRGIRLLLNLKVDGKTYTTDGSGIARLQGTKPSGAKFSHVGYYIPGYTWMSHLLEADMTDEAGDVVAHLVIEDGEDRTGSQNFIIRVQKSAL